LIVDPCIPTSWKKFSVVRKFRNSTYNITVTNPKNISKGVKKLLLDGKPLSGNVIPVLNDGKEHVVEAELG
jgi:cellobiose phosphorylase